MTANTDYSDGIGIVVYPNQEEITFNVTFKTPSELSRQFMCSVGEGQRNVFGQQLQDSVQFLHFRRIVPVAL